MHETSGSARPVWLHLEPAANHRGSIVHDVQPHALAVPAILRNAGAVIHHEQRAAIVRGCQAKHEVARVSMFQRVIHCFLGNVVEMRCDPIVMDQDRGFALKSA